MRHADVENPRRVLYGFLPGFPLSALGRAQAAAVGRSLRESGIRRIVHSPLERAKETAELVNAQLPEPVPLIPEPALIEAEMSRSLQGVPYWQIPLRRPRWFVHRLQRGRLPGDETIEGMGGRVRDVVLRLARDHPGEVALCISHADPIQAAWVLFDGRPQTEREMSRKAMQRAGMLQLEIDAGRLVSIRYVPTPNVSAAQLDFLA